MEDWIKNLHEVTGGNDFNQDVSDWLGTGYLPLNKAISGRYDGGFPVGRITEVYGGPSCLAADTFVNYRVKSKYTGKVQNWKGGTIERLFQRFHKIERKKENGNGNGNGKGYYQRPSTMDSEFFVPSMDEEGFIRVNKIIDVLMNGEKECFRVTTESGKSISATKEHRFFTGAGFVVLSDLNVGDTVYVHDNVQPKTSNGANLVRKTWSVKHHPVAKEKIVEGKYVYKRMMESRFIYEAYMNGIAPEEYRGRLNAGELEGLVFLSEDQHVHHIDENFENNAKENLVVLNAVDHGKLHMGERTEKPRYVVMPEKIVAIESVGVHPTYDIMMDDPYRNYVANKFVVHNSGKTLLATMAMIETQRKGGLAVFLDHEHSFSIARAQQLGLSIEPQHWLFKQPMTAEEGLGIVKTVCELVDQKGSAKHVTAVIDSVAAMVTKEELEAGLDGGNMRTRLSLAAAMSSNLKKVVGIVNKRNVTLIFLNQVRLKPGVIYGDNESTSGGEALKFFASTRIRLSKGPKVKESSDPKSEIVGEKVHAKVVKNKVHRPFQQVEWTSDFTFGIDLDTSHVEALVAMGKLQSKAGFIEFEGKKYRQRQLVAYMKDEPGVRARIIGMFLDDNTKQEDAA